MADIQAMLTALQTALEANGTLTALVTPYHMTAPDNVALPTLVWDVVSTEVEKGFDNFHIARITVQFDIYSRLEAGVSAAASAATIEDALFAQFDETALAATSWDRGLILFQTRGVRFVDEDGLRVTSEAVITGRTTA